MLQAIFHFQESLVKQQQQCRIIQREGAEYIVDDLFLLRNHILFSTYLMGGPNERKLPSLDISNKNSIFQLPVPSEHLPIIDYKFEKTHSSHQHLSDFIDSLDDSFISNDDLLSLRVF